MYDFDPSTATPLCKIMGDNKSDKGSENITRSWHNYTTFYYSIFKHMQNKELRVFELGLGTNNTSLPSNMGADGRPGASLYGWKEFFPQASIFGADIDKDILFVDEKIKTYYCDQRDPGAIARMWAEPDLAEGFDIMVDDGLHSFNANACFFEHSIAKLKSGGWYIIEDVSRDDWGRFQNKIREWQQSYPHLQFDMVKIPSTVNTYDNSLVVVHHKTSLSNSGC